MSQEAGSATLSDAPERLCKMTQHSLLEVEQGLLVLVKVVGVAGWRQEPDGNGRGAGGEETQTVSTENI